jgi:hypothetical protein
MYSTSLGINPGATIDLLNQLAPHLNAATPEAISHWKMFIQNTGTVGVCIGGPGADYAAKLGHIVAPGKDFVLDSERETVFANADAAATVNAFLSILIVFS